MLNPDVTEILNDPEVGGGVSFQVRRVLNTRTKGSVTQTPVIYPLTGNIQPQNKSTQSSTVEDLLNESIVVYALFDFQTGENNGGTFTGPDEILWKDRVWRVTNVNNWTDWGFNIAYATKVMDSKLVSPMTVLNGDTDPEEQG